MTQGEIVLDNYCNCLTKSAMSRKNQHSVVGFYWLVFLVIDTLCACVLSSGWNIKYRSGFRLPFIC